MSKTKAKPHYKDSKGNILPGVTTITGTLGWNKQALIKWANNLGLKGQDSSKFRDEKASIGKLAHRMIMQYLSGYLRTDIENLKDYSRKEIEQAENSLLSFFEWEKSRKLEPILIEEPITWEDMGFGGTPDFFGLVNGKPELIDFKTGSGIYDEYIIQLPAYKQLIINSNKTGELPKRVRILRIPRSEDEAFEERLLSGRELKIGWRIFVNCLNIYKLKKELK